MTTIRNTVARIVNAFTPWETTDTLITAIVVLSLTIASLAVGMVWF